MILNIIISNYINFVEEANINPSRHRKIKQGQPGKGPVAYWMSRDQRATDNWALLFAQKRSQNLNQPLVVLFYLSSIFLEANKTHFAFMIQNLKNVEKDLVSKNIPFYLITGNLDKFVDYLKTRDIAELVTDFDPLKIKRKWKKEIISKIKAPVYEVDAHNIVPCWEASNKKEYGAYTLRPKINRLRDKYLTEFEILHQQSSNPDPSYYSPEWDKIFNWPQSSGKIPHLKTIPGEKQAFKTMENFFEIKLNSYSEKRNDPVLDFTSGLSPYLHYGQISAQRVALEALKFKPDRNLESFLEELIVRRELSDNFCYYNLDYDKFEGFPAWAQKTLQEHSNDKRPYLYQLDQLEKALTHDPAWNAAQNQMVLTGYMHGYMRMYWAKKILEWSPDPQQALDNAIYLNNHYLLDGRDPNGYTGIAWSIGGVHDRAWNERNTLGKIRYMSLSGLKRKFNVADYIAKIEQLN